MAKVAHRAEFIGLMIFSPGFGFAYFTGETAALLGHPHAAQVKSKTGGLSSHICAHGAEGTRVWPFRESLSPHRPGVDRGKWNFAVGFIQNFKSADLICCMLSFCPLQDQTSQHRFPGRSL